MNRMNPKVDAFLSKAKKWPEEFEKLRMIILDCQLTEELKWGFPCYTFENRNIVLIHGFKEYCALLFFQHAGSGDLCGRALRQFHLHDPSGGWPLHRDPAICGDLVRPGKAGRRRSGQPHLRCVL